MLHCCRLLSQTQTLQLLRPRLTYAYRSSLGTASVPSRPYTTIFNVQPRRSAHVLDATSQITSPGGRVRPHILKRPTPVSLPLQTAEEPRDGAPTTAYEKQRSQDRSLVANLPVDSYLYVVARAFKTGCSKLANQVTLDILEVYQGGDSNRTIMLRAIVSQDFSILERETLLLVLQALQRSPRGLDFLSTASVNRLTRMVTDISISNETNRNLIKLIYPKLLIRVQQYKAPGGIYPATFFPPPIINASFRMLHKLLTESYQQQALGLFQVLVDLGQIPPEAIQGLDVSSNDLKLIVCSALIKASLHWNWRRLAVMIQTDILGSYDSPSQSIIDLNIDTIYALLDTPNLNDIHACGHLIRNVHQHAPVPDSVIRYFYNKAAEFSLPAPAESLYAFARSPEVLKVHHYPPPQGVALPFLMRYLCVEGRKKYLSRELASEVVNDNLPIPLQSRAEFISLAAAQGYGKLSRILWERYATGRDKHVITGSSTLMIRMVSLFKNIARRARPSHDSNSSDLKRGALQLSDDADSFLQRVLAEYRAHFEPLGEAPHRALTSYARACFIVGKFTEGFSVFRYLLDRKETPDIYDVNVALSAIAELQPQLAVKMIERMNERGLQPDAVTFGTVMHHALLHKDQSLVESMIRQVRGLKDTQLTLKTVMGLVRAYVAGEDSKSDKSKAAQRSKLSVALGLLESLAETKLVSSPQTGKYLVSSALRADDPVMAFKFWKLLLKESAEWDDNEQQHQRRTIARMLRGRVDGRQLAGMLRQLGE